MKPGEVINPGIDGVYDNDGVPQEHRQSGAYAATDQDTAQTFAGNKQRDQSGQGSLFAPVYPVEHVSEHSDPMSKLGDSFPNYRRDTSGFRVTGQPSSYALNPTALPPALPSAPSEWE